jgi:hypothetical protein
MLITCLLKVNKMYNIKLSSVVFALMVCGVSNADVILSAESCKPQAVTITSIKSVFPVGQELVDNGPINSTACLGFVTTPSNDWGNNPSPNLGGLEDGLMNGEVVKGIGQDNNSYYVAGDEFLTNNKDSMIDLDGDSVADDPGWIRLGGAETETNGIWDFEYDSIGGLSLASLITMTLNNDGNWSLAVDPYAITAVTNELGRPTVFDHLAFVMKGPNNGGEDFGSWAIYDFNFYDLIDNGLNISLGDTAYDFEGTWDVNMFNNDNALSHFSIWAHDPPATTTVVPEPSTLAIFVLGMIGLVTRRFKKYL